MTITDAVDELADILGTPQGIAVRKYQALPTDTGPVVVIGDPDGMSLDATEWYVPVKLYQKASQPTGPEAQQSFLANCSTIDTLLRNASLIVRMSAQAVPATDQYLAIFAVDVPRQDFSS